MAYDDASAGALCARDQAAMLARSRMNQLPQTQQDTFDQAGLAPIVVDRNHHVGDPTMKSETSHYILRLSPHDHAASVAQHQRPENKVVTGMGTGPAAPKNPFGSAQIDPPPQYHAAAIGRMQQNRPSPYTATNSHILKAQDANDNEPSVEGSCSVSVCSMRSLKSAISNKPSIIKIERNPNLMYTDAAFQSQPIKVTVGLSVVAFIATVITYSLVGHNENSVHGASTGTLVWIIFRIVALIFFCFAVLGIAIVKAWQGIGTWSALVGGATVTSLYCICDAVFWFNAHASTRGRSIQMVLGILLVITAFCLTIVAFVTTYALKKFFNSNREADRYEANLTEAAREFNSRKSTRRVRFQMIEEHDPRLVTTEAGYNPPMNSIPVAGVVQPSSNQMDSTSQDFKQQPMTVG